MKVSTRPLYMPVLAGKAGMQALCVRRNDRARFVSFSERRDAEKTIEALLAYDIIHVVGQVVASPTLAEAELAVWETSIEELEYTVHGARFGVDLCVFVPPHYVILRKAYLISSDRDAESMREALERIVGA